MLFYFSPAPSTPPAKEEEWSDIPSDVVHLKDDTFDDFIANNPSVLVMFYAPCKYHFFFIYLYLPGLVGTRKSKSLTCLFSVSCYHFVINWFLLKKKKAIQSERVTYINVVSGPQRSSLRRQDHGTTVMDSFMSSLLCIDSWPFRVWSLQSYEAWIHRCSQNNEGGGGTFSLNIWQSAINSILSE